MTNYVHLSQASRPVIHLESNPNLLKENQLEG